MYLIGGPHPNKIAAEQALARVAGTERLITNAEVLQEIAHRYAALERRDAIQTAFEVVLKLVEEVLPGHVGDCPAREDPHARPPASVLSGRPASGDAAGARGHAHPDA